jgi:hypothetical protein
MIDTPLSEQDIVNAVLRDLYALPDTVQLATHYVYAPDKPTYEAIKDRLPHRLKVYIGAFSPSMWEDTP